tara:strand:+ start:4336 stop:4623 length:288 start_codon:yes stop_codon:yes gene_type:complete
MKLSKEQQEELQKLTDEITQEAKSVVKEYADIQSDASGSEIHIHENSPYLDEEFKNETWKKVIKVNDPSQVIQDINEHNKKVRKNKKDVVKKKKK